MMERLILVLVGLGLIQSLIKSFADMAMDKKLDVILIKLESLEFKGEVLEEAVNELTITTKLASGREQGKLEEVAQVMREHTENVQSLGYELNGVRELIDSKANELDKTVKTECGRILFTPLKIKYEDRVV